MAQLPQGSRVFASVNPTSEWTYERSYLAAIVDTTNTIAWQLSGAKKNKKPESVVPKNVIKDAKRAEHRKNAIPDQHSMNISDIQSLLNRPRQ